MKCSLLPSLLLAILALPCWASDVTISTTSLPGGTVAIAYSAMIKANGGCSPYTWKLVSGSLPAGVAKQTSSTTTSLNLYGKPTTAGTYYPTISVTGCGGYVSKHSYKMVIQSSGAVAISTLSLPTGTVETAYSAVIHASGGCTPYKWNLVSGSLPAGIAKQVSPNTTSLNVYGKPTTVATYYPTISVTACGGYVSKKSYKIVIQSGHVAISTTNLPSGTVSKAYSAAIKASGGCTPYVWKLVSGNLPAGVAKQISTNTTYLNLYGTPTAAATYYPTISVTGCGGHVSEVSYKIVIQSSGSVAISTLSLPNGTLKTPYSAAIKASGGCTPYSWNLLSGSLPTGVSRQVSADTTSLNLYGTPTTAATYAPTISVSGCGSASQHAYRIVIQATANHIVDLKWNASTSADVAGYNVYRGLDGTTWKRINVALVGSTVYTDSTVANSTTYYYTTTAVDIYGRESKKSGAVRAAIP